MYFIVLLWLILVSVASTLHPLRKHHYNMQAAVDESDYISNKNQQSNATQFYSNDDSVCGTASISCMAFGYSSSIPVRCGILKNAPVCKRQDVNTGIVKCDSFCDTDGSGRLCRKAFPKCCQKSRNGCISSKPRDIQFQ